MLLERVTRPRVTTLTLCFALQVDAQILEWSIFTWLKEGIKKYERVWGERHVVKQRYNRSKKKQTIIQEFTSGQKCLDEREG
ncbi:hypothetical protein PM082_022998 [Marasmius tenuissimus]|nr:hypothetical protein PM082_011593 [Marasmius tenuissimus]KAJ8092548.1 hypothetical protein PM082_023802 [Marasmius tenuissimus]KAJ8095592.1 hypothetical protein PM082_022998 [Marasmius tenuissimus]